MKSLDKFMKFANKFCNFMDKYPPHDEVLKT